MCSIKSQNTLENQRGKERPVGFSHGHLAYSSVRWSPRIPSTMADSALLRSVLRNESKIPWKTGPYKSHLTAGCMEILYTWTYHEAWSQKANSVLRAYVGTKSTCFLPSEGWTQSFKLKLKEHRIIGGKGNKKENKKNGIGKRQEFLGGRGVLKNKNKNLEDI